MKLSEQCLNYGVHMEEKRTAALECALSCEDAGMPDLAAMSLKEAEHAEEELVRIQRWALRAEEKGR